MAWIGGRGMWRGGKGEKEGGINERQWSGHITEALSCEWHLLNRAVRWSGLLLEHFPVCGYRIIGVRIDTEVSYPVRPV